MEKQSCGFSELLPLAPGPAGGAVFQTKIVILSNPLDPLGSSLVTQE